MDSGALIIIAIILFNIFRAYRKSKKKSAKTPATIRQASKQQSAKTDSKGKLEDWLGDYLKQIENAANDQNKKSETEELNEEQHHSVFEKDTEEAEHYEKEREKHFKLREEKKKHRHSDLYKGKVNKDFFEERLRIAKSRKRIEHNTDNAAFNMSKKKQTKMRSGEYRFSARDAVIGSVILQRYQDPLKRQAKF